jgi:hypothetical protein
MMGVGMSDHDHIISRLQHFKQVNQKPKTSRFHRFRYAVALIVAPLMVPAAYYVDTRLFPVVGQASGVFTDKGDPDKTYVRFIFQKHRNCKFVGSSFWVSEPITRPVTLLQSGPPVHYPPGKTGTSTFVLDVPQARFIDHGSFIVEHRCHSLWDHQRVIFGGN